MADESFQLVRQADFGYCQLNKNNACLALNSPSKILVQNYQYKYQPVMEQRLLLAAKRLHQLLDYSL